MLSLEKLGKAVEMALVADDPVETFKKLMEGLADEPSEAPSEGQSSRQNEPA
jgi:hypothetical protein